MASESENKRTMTGVMANNQSALCKVHVLALAMARLDASGKIRETAENRITNAALVKKTGL